MSNPKDNLTPREAKLVEGLVASKTQAQAMRDAGFSEAMAMASTEVLNKPAVRSALEEFQAKLKAKITDDRLVNKVSELMEAKRPDKWGNEASDNQTQYKATELALRINRYIKDDKDSVNVQVNVQNVLD